MTHKGLSPVTLLDLPSAGDVSESAIDFEDFGFVSQLEMEPLCPSEAGVDYDFASGTHISELPTAVLTVIFGMVVDPRSRNCLSLACRDWYYLERLTRASLILRGNVCNFISLPVSFRFVQQLDLSTCSPWGYSVFQYSTDGEVIGQMLRAAFPNVKDLTIYVRNVVDIRMVVWVWPELESLKLVRFHQRSAEMASEVEPILRCEKLRKVDLSEFYCWTEDILPALEARAATAATLVSLNLLKLSPEGFQSREIIDITAICVNLEEFFVLCNFDPRYADSVGDNALESIGNHCPKLRVLHLVDNKEWQVCKTDADDAGATTDDSNVTFLGLESMFKKLVHLQDLVLLLGHNVWDSRVALEALFTNCPKLQLLHLSHFHGVCPGPARQGLALGSNLLNLSIKSSSDLTDLSLVAIVKGCKKLKTLSLKDCKGISERGLNSCARALLQTLVDVEIHSCPNLRTLETLRALEPIRNSIQRLHIDCVWDDDVVAQQAEAIEAGDRAGNVEDKLQAKIDKSSLGSCVTDNGCSSINASINLEACFGSEVIGGTTSWASTSRDPQHPYPEDLRISNGERCDLANEIGGVFGSGRQEEGTSSTGLDYCGSRDLDENESAKRARIFGNGLSNSWTSAKAYDLVDESPDKRCWRSLQSLSLWVGVGVLITPLPSMGLGLCPKLHEVNIKVEGDYKLFKRPASRDWGLSTLCRYEALTKLTLDLGDVVSFSLSAPVGMVDLSIWERYYLSGIDELRLEVLIYKPPCDKDLDHRGLSLPAVAHLSQCGCIRKLIVLGSAHEHFLSMLQRLTSMRDFQLRWEFFPAPEYETRNEVRVEACRRFEAALEERGFPD